MHLSGGSVAGFAGIDNSNSTAGTRQDQCSGESRGSATDDDDIKLTHVSESALRVCAQQQMLLFLGNQHSINGWGNTRGSTLYSI
jgi:hypothetical protein